VLKFAQTNSISDFAKVNKSYLCFLTASAARISEQSDPSLFELSGNQETMEKAPVKIDTLLEPLLLETSDGQADELLLQIINVHAEPVIKGVIRYKLRLSSSRATQQAEADDLYQDVILQFRQSMLPPIQVEG